MFFYCCKRCSCTFRFLKHVKTTGRERRTWFNVFKGTLPPPPPTVSQIAFSEYHLFLIVMACIEQLSIILVDPPSLTALHFESSLLYWLLLVYFVVLKCTQLKQSCLFSSTMVNVHDKICSSNRICDHIRLP